VWRDEYGPQEEKIKEINPFVELLWNKGVAHEKQIVGELGDYLDLSQGSLEEREQQTTAAINDKVPMIYQGVISADDLLGIPDLLVLEQDVYCPVDIKSGMGMEGVSHADREEGRPKKNYAVQLAVYLDILIRNRITDRRIAYIIDKHGHRVAYDLNSIANKKTDTTYWDLYQDCLADVRQLVSGGAINDPALSSVCKLCNWYYSCKTWAEDTQDLTKLYRCGRSVRDTLSADTGVKTVTDLIDLSIEDQLSKKKENSDHLKGVGEKTLKSLQLRAKLMHEQRSPVLHKDIVLPKVAYELFFDIEDDPTQEFVYMHGIYVRTSEQEYFMDFTAKEISADAEKKAWMDFWEYIRSLPSGDYAVYYYSHHEKTTYLKMQKKYPQVITEAEVLDFFDDSNVIDLFRLIDSHTDWPVGSYSLKDLAVYLGFEWRDTSPSGALSIKWFNEYIDSQDTDILTRILEYNEDDCKATMVLKDGLQNLIDQRS